MEISFSFQFFFPIPKPGGGAPVMRLQYHAGRWFITFPNADGPTDSKVIKKEKTNKQTNTRVQQNINYIFQHFRKLLISSPHFPSIFANKNSIFSSSVLLMAIS